MLSLPIMWKSCGALVASRPRRLVAMGATAVGRGFLQATSSAAIHQRYFATGKLALIKELRSRSGAPMVDCQSALKQHPDDIEAALDWLRKSGASKAAQKVAQRSATEGLIALKFASDGQSAALVQLFSETDFAGRSSTFVDLVSHVAQAVLETSEDEIQWDPLKNGKDREALESLQVAGKSVHIAMDDAMVAIRENLQLGPVVKWKTNNSNQGNSLLYGYVHGRVEASQSAGRAAALVQLSADGGDLSGVAEVGKQLAMHIVAAKPHYLSAETVPEEVVEKEKAVLEAQLSNDDKSKKSKPPEVLAKIVQGRLRKFYEGICLLEQEHLIAEGNPRVSKVMEDAGVTVERFELMSI